MTSMNQKNDYDNEPDSMFYSPPQDDDSDDDDDNDNRNKNDDNINNRTNNDTYESQLPPKTRNETQQVGHQNYNDDDDDDDEDYNDDERKRLNNNNRNNDNENYDNDDYDNENPRSNPRFKDDDDDDLGGVEDDDNDDYDPPVHSKKKRKCCACCSYKNIKNYCLTCYLPKCEFRGICGCPHGKCYGIIGVMTAVGGLMMNLYIIGTCSFNRIKILNPVTGEPIPGSERGYGFNSRETNYGQTPDYRQCTYYPDDEKDEIYDSWIVTGKMFAYISALLAIIGFLILFSICCIAYSKSMFERWLLWLYIIAAITVTFSFFIFGSEFCQINQCKVADGCGWAISAFFLHLMAANSVKSFPAAKPRPNPNDQKKNSPPTIDDVYDELYYDNDADKYPLPSLPDGQKRGVIINEQGEPEFDDGEDYFDELGNYIDPDKKDNDDEQRQRGDNDDDDDEYTYGSDDDDDEYEESEYDSDEEEYDTWKKRQDDRKTEREERKRQKELEQQPGYSDSDPYAFEPPTDIDDNDDKQGGAGYVPPTTTTTPPYRQAPSSSNYNDDDIDPLSGIPYADPHSRTQPIYDNTERSTAAIRPEDRVFPLNDDNDGNIGVGYEHLDNDTPQSMAGSGSNETDPSNKSKTKKVLYGAPPRPNIHEPRDYDDDEDDDGPVMA